MRETPKLTGFLAFVAVACVGLTLFISALISSSRAIQVLQNIAYIAAYAVIIIASFFYVAPKRNVVFWVIWVVGVTLLILGGFVI